MKFRLPPLNTLRLFESAGRNLSFKKAAKDLNVTPSAVSHGIQTLEDWLGLQLFFRTSRGLALTEAGEAYLPCVREALAALSAGSARLPGKAPSGKLTISSAPTFAARWLIPNLPTFRAQCPDIDVVIDSSHRRVEFPLDGVDIAIRRGNDPSPKLDSVLLAPERLFPVCAPNLVRKVGGTVDLSTATLIHVTTTSDDWEAWGNGAGVAGLDLSRGLRFDTIQMAFDAAVHGLGVAIGRSPLVDSEIAGGRLAQCHKQSVLGAHGHWFVCPKEAVNRAEVAAFRTWILSKMADSLAS